MKQVIFILYLSVICFTHIYAQDTLTLDGQPNWKKAMGIEDYCLFYDEVSDKELSFDEIKTKEFKAYSKELRGQIFTTRPLLVQWFKFVIRNSSNTDTLRLWLSSVHCFTRLYNADSLLFRSGAYEPYIDLPGESPVSYARGKLTILQKPNSTCVYWFRTEDRQNHLIPPFIKLDTIFTGLTEEVENGFAARYLFLLMAAMVGCFFFVGAYALYHYFLYKDSAYLWYLSYCIAAFFSGLHWMDIRLGMAMFSPFFHDLIFSIFVYLIPVLYSFFIGDMLQLKKYFKKGWLIVKVLVFICIFQMAIQLLEVRFGWFPFNKDYYGILLVPIPIMLLNIVLLVLAAMSKSRVKWFLFIGISSLLVLWCLPLLRIYEPSTDMNPELFLVINFAIFFLLLGLTIEAICFSFAISYRSKLVVEEKNRLERSYRESLEEALLQRTNELQIQNKLMEVQKVKQLEAEFEMKIAETEMVALRAQMNPHFIFNCLNSIKLYTLENDSSTASAYLTKFSQLIRLVLENSRTGKVTLKKELETLELYVELESMRFKEKVKFDLFVDPEIDQQYVELPPLLLQPYVENAIWHGLMHKPGGGTISVHITQPNEFLLHVEISDNGIGREKAMEHKSKSATVQKSFGLKMTSERLEVLNQIYKTKTEVDIVDLKDSDGNSSGTKIILDIPL